MLSANEKKNALWNSGSFVVTSILGFVNFTLNYNSFTTEVFGLFILINSIFGIGYNVDFGFGVSTVKHIAESLKKKDFTLVNSIIVTFFVVFLSIGIILLIVFALYYYIVFKKTNVVVESNVEGAFVIYFAAVGGFFFRYLSNYIGRVFEGFSKFNILAKINITMASINTLFVLSVFVFKLSIVTLALFYAFNSFFLCLVLIIAAFNKIDVLRFKWSNFKLKILKRYVVYSINIQFSFIIGSLIDPIVKFIIGGSFGLNMVTFYESAKRIIDLSNGLIFSAQKEVLVKLSESNASGQLKEFLNEKIHIYSKIANYYSILIYGVLNPLICAFILLWLNNFEPLLIFLFFLPAYSLINFGGALYSVLMIEGKGTKLLIIQILNVLLTSAALYGFISISNNFLGLYGFYVAIVINTILLIYFIKSGYDFNYKEFLKKVKFDKIVLLNVLIISQSLLIFFFNEHLYLILAGYFLVYIVFYRKLVSQFYDQFKSKGLVFLKNLRS